MKYKLDIEYRQKPIWLTRVIAYAKAHLDGTETFDGVTSKIEDQLDNVTITTRASKSSGSQLIRKLCYDTNTMTIYNQNNSVICAIKYIRL